VVWLDGSEEERHRLIRQAVAEGELFDLNHDKLPGCYLHRSALNKERIEK
jgi:phosphoenolpyruvate carboxykinase (GTP)